MATTRHVCRRALNTWYDVAPKVRCSSAYEKFECNWAENVPFAHSALSLPRDLGELQSAVAEASKVRVVGSGHSFNPLYAEDGEALISLCNMASVVGFVESEPTAPNTSVTASTTAHSNSMTVRIEGGTTFGEVGRWLLDRGAALYNMPSFPHPTVAGALATGTHGSGVKADDVRSCGSNLVSQVAAVEVVVADGTVLRYTRDDSELLAVLTSFGLAGVVSAIELDVVAAFDVNQATYAGASFASFAENVVELGQQHHSVACFLDFESQSVGALFLRDFVDCVEPGSASSPTQPPPPVNTPPPPPFKTGGGELVPAFEDHVVHGTIMFESMARKPGTARGTWLELLPFHIGAVAPYRDDPFYALMLQAEFYVPLQHAEAALKALQPVAGALSGWRSADEWVGRPEGLEGLVIGTEIRLVKGAGLECWMSPFREDSLAIHFSFKHDMAAALVACRTLQRCLAPFGGRVHWGKLFDAEEFGTGGTGDGRKRLEMLFPNVNDFRALCQRHDPGGKFRNAYLNKLLF